MRMGPPALAALAARALRGRLLGELATIESGLKAAAAQRAPSTRAPSTKAPQPAPAPAPPASGARRSARQRAADEFGCAPGCSHTHCGRSARAIAADGGAPAAEQGPAEEGLGGAVSEPEQTPQRSLPPGFVRVVGLTPGAGERTYRRSGSGSSWGEGSGRGGTAGAAARPPRPPPLMPAPSAAALGQSADPFFASGTVSDLPLSPSAAAGPATDAEPASPLAGGLVAVAEAESASTTAGRLNTALAAGAADRSPEGPSLRERFAGFSTTSAAHSPFMDSTHEGTFDGGDGGEANGIRRQNSMIRLSVRAVPPTAQDEAGASTSSDAGSCTAAGGGPGGGAAAGRQSAIAGASPMAAAAADRRAPADARRPSMPLNRRVSGLDAASRMASMAPAASRRSIVASARSLAAADGTVDVSSPPLVRRASMLREAVAASASRTGSILRLGSGLLRHNVSEMVRSRPSLHASFEAWRGTTMMYFRQGMPSFKAGCRRSEPCLQVLDARLGDVYTGGNGGPSPAVEHADGVAPTEATPATAPAANNGQRASFDSDAAVQVSSAMQVAGLVSGRICS